jgi:hypothetical protein
MPTTTLQQAPSVQLHPALAATLPSANSAWALVTGQPGALPLVVCHTVLRAGIIGVGLAVAGQRQSLVKNALVSSLAIEAFVLGWAAWQKGRQG